MLGRFPSAYGPSSTASPKARHSPVCWENDQFRNNNSLQNRLRADDLRPTCGRSEKSMFESVHQRLPNGVTAKIIARPGDAIWANGVIECYSGSDDAENVAATWCRIATNGHAFNAAALTIRNRLPQNYCQNRNRMISRLLPG